MITTEMRGHLMAARDQAFRAGDGHGNVNLELVAAHLDHALEALCPHLPVTWKTQLDEHGRSLTTCYACGMSWYNHERFDQNVPYVLARQQAAYMASLELRLLTRTRDHGFAYVIPSEGDRLTANNLYQPGHTTHRFSTPTEDRSDAALEAPAHEADVENEGAPSRNPLVGFSI
jgi:hypothetical protein